MYYIDIDNVQQYEGVGNPIGHKIRSRSFRFTPEVPMRTKKNKGNVNDRASASRQLFYVIFDDIFNKLDRNTQCHKLKCFLDNPTTIGLSVNEEKVRICSPLLYAVCTSSMRRGHEIS